MNWNAALNQYGNLVRQVCYEYEKDPDDLEELMQDVWTRAVEKFEQFNGGADFGTWLHAVAESVSRNRIRHNESRPEILYYSDLSGTPPSLETDDVLEFDDTQDEIFSGSLGTPEEWAQAEQISDILDKASDLTKLAWIVFHLQAIKGQSTAEISETLDIEESTVRTYLQRVREQIEEILEDNNNPPPWIEI